MKINYHQLSILVFMSFIGLKFLALPGWMYVESGNMSWLVALVLMIVDGLFALLILDLLKKSGNKNIYEFMKEILGTVVAKIILLLFVAKLLIVIAILGKSLEFFIIENLYEDINWFAVGVPVMLLSGYMIYKGIRNIARVMEMFWVIVICACLYIAFKSFSGVDPLVYLPMFKDGAKPLFESAFVHINWFGSSVFMFMLFGSVSLEKNKKTNIAWFILGAILLVQLLMFVFYGLFDETSPLHQFCLSDISQFTMDRSSVAELSWLVVSIWIVAQLTIFAMYGYSCVRAIMLLFNIKNPAFGILFIYSYVLFWGIITQIQLKPERFLYMPYASVITITCQYVVPILLSVAYFFHEKQKNKKDNKSKSNKNSKDVLVGET